ncbi:hypothetical protein G6O69_36035 [Pseudenhygromyxa sp. WMMC2535]|nr:hypothetical protein [Pseudenhygromyxa sp. WMMC2535]
MTTKNRSELKAFFVKNAIPTEANFGELIDGQLNQADDGVFKLGDDPLSVVAAPGDQKRVLRLYAQYPAQAPTWTLSLKPRTAPANAKTAAEGLGFDAPDGSNKLFLSPEGKLGVGTTSPSAKLTVSDGDLLVEGGSMRRAMVSSDGPSGLVLSSGESNGHPYIDLNHGQFSNANKYGVRLVSAENGKLSVMGAQLGVGVNPDAMLDVNGQALVRGRLRVQDGLVLSSGSEIINTSGALFRKDGHVWVTAEKNLLVRGVGDSDWSIALNAQDASVRAKGGVIAGQGNRGGHLNADISLYRKDEKAWMTLSDHLLFRKPNDGNEWGLSLRADGLVQTKHALSVSAGNLKTHFDTDGALYRYEGQVWLTVDDNFYIRDTKHTGMTRSFWFDTTNSDLHIANDIMVNGGTLNMSSGWKIETNGDHMFFKKGNNIVARFSVQHDRFQVYRNLNGQSPYFYYNSAGKRP